MSILLYRYVTSTWCRDISRKRIAVIKDGPISQGGVLFQRLRKCNPHHHPSITCDSYHPLADSYTLRELDTPLCRVSFT